MSGIDAVRGLAVVLVVLMHTAYVVPHGLPALYVGMNTAFGAFRMPVLFLVSGFLASRKLDHPRAMADRAANLAWLFILWTCLDLAAAGGIARISPSELVAPTTHLWYIWALTVLMVACCLLRRVPGYWLVAVTLGCSLVIDSDAIVIENFAIDHTLKAAVFFVIGARYGASLLRISMDRPVSAFAIGLMLVALLHVTNAGAAEILGWPPLRTPERLSACGAVLAAAAFVARYRAFAVLSWLGTRTLPIFLAHPIILRALPPLSLDAYADPILYTVIAIAVSLAGHATLRRIGLRWLYVRPAFLAVRERTPRQEMARERQSPPIGSIAI